MGFVPLCCPTSKTQVGQQKPNVFNNVTRGVPLVPLILKGYVCIHAGAHVRVTYTHPYRVGQVGHLM